MHCSAAGNFEEVPLNSPQFTLCSDPNAAVSVLGSLTTSHRFENIHCPFIETSQDHICRTNASPKSTHAHADIYRRSEYILDAESTQVDNMLALLLFNNILSEPWLICFYCLHGAIRIFLIIMLLHFKAAASLACSALIPCIKIVLIQVCISVVECVRTEHALCTAVYVDAHTLRDLRMPWLRVGKDPLNSSSHWSQAEPPLPPLSVPFSPAPSLSHAERQAALTMNQSCVERFDCRWG